MHHQIAPDRPQSTLGPVLEDILATGRITSAHAEWLRQAGMSLETPLSAEEQAKIARVFYRLKIGLLRVTP